MSSESRADQIRRERERLRARYGTLLDEITAILFKHDPVDLPYNSNEYAPEARTILPRLEQAHTVDDAKRIVLAEFRRWFRPKVTIHEDRCVSAAIEIWQVWCERRAH